MVWPGGRARAGVGAAFVGHAVISGSWAARVPAIKHALHLSDAQLGLALFGMAFGTLIGSRVGGALAARFGAWHVVRGGLPAFAAALVVAALAPGLATLTAALVGWGVIAAVVDVSMNAEAVVVEREHARPLMSGFHGLWSVGLLVGGSAGVGAAALGLRPRDHFALVALLVAASSVPALAALPRRAAPPLREEATAGGGSVGLVVLGLIGFCAFFAEGVAADWIAVFLRDRAGAGGAVAAAGFACFALAMAVSRLVGGRLIVRFGPVRVARASSLTAAAGLALALSIPVPIAGLIGFALMGAGLAPVVPAVISAAAGAGLGRPERVVARVFGIGYGGGISGPAVIGFAAGQVGLRAALVIPIGLIACVAVAAGRLSTALDQIGPVGHPR